MYKWLNKEVIYIIPNENPLFLSPFDIHFVPESFDARWGTPHFNSRLKFRWRHQNGFDLSSFFVHRFVWSEKKGLFSGHLDHWRRCLRSSFFWSICIVFAACLCAHLSPSHTHTRTQYFFVSLRRVFVWVKPSGVSYFLVGAAYFPALRGNAQFIVNNSGPI